MNAPAKTSTAKSRAPKINYGAEFEQAQEEATADADNRFALAEAAIKSRPSALAPAARAAGFVGGGQGSAPGSAAPGAVMGTPGAFDVHALTVGQTCRVPLSLIDPNPYSPRYFYKSARVDETAMSMQKKGQKVPVNGYVTANGRVQLIEGGTRLRGARAIGDSTLEVKIEAPPKDDLELYNRAVEFHDERTNHTALDTAMLMRKLLDEGVCESQDDLATKIRVNGSAPSKATVSTYLRISRNIPERLLLQMADHEATSSVRVAYAISGFFAHDEYEKDKDRFEVLAEEVIHEVISKGLGAKDVESLVKTKLEGPKPRQSSESTNVKFGEAKGVIKLFEQRGQLDFSIKGVPADKLPALKATIEAICAGRTPLAEAG